MSNDVIERNKWRQIAPLIFEATGEMQYGNVEITIHDGRVVQVEVTEKFRLAAAEQSSRQPERRVAVQ